MSVTRCQRFSSPCPQSQACHEACQEEPDVLVKNAALGLEARDGAQAIELALAQTPDIILMDLSLPIVDGATASRRIKESTNSIPIVALTAHEEEDVRGSVDPDDYVAFVTKPVSFSRLLAVLSAQLSRRL